MPNLRKIANELETSRINLLFDEQDEQELNDPEVQQLFLLGLGAMEQATRFFALADVKQAQAVASVQLGGKKVG